MYIRGSFEKRYWAHVQKTDGCWEWTGAKEWKGYGIITRDGQSRRAHREAWRMAFGEVPDGLFVCHSCDNRGPAQRTGCAPGETERLFGITEHV